MSINAGIASAAAGAPSPVTVADYDGTTPFTDDAGPPATFQGRVRAGVTATIVAVPFAGLGVAVWLAWGRGLNLADILLAVGFYVITGLGVTIGFHRLLTHRSFTAVPALRVALAVAGSMSFEGPVIGWVAIHRRHHAFTDRPGDPHSPYRYGTSLAGQLRGLAHAHAGWLLRDDPTPPERYAPDMTADRSMRADLGRVPRPVRSVPRAAVRRRMADRRQLAHRAARTPVGRAGPRHRAAARDLERQLTVPRVRQPPLRHPTPRPRHESVAARPRVVR